MKKVFALSLVCLMIMLAGCGTVSEDVEQGADETTLNKLDEIIAKDSLVVYTDPNFPPFEFHGANGIEGVDIEVAKAIADEIGVSMKFIENKFDAILMAIANGDGDIAISGFTITDERKENVDFSDPYFESVQYLMLPEGSEIKTIEDLADKKVGVANGYTGAFLMEDETTAEGVLYGKNTEITEYNSANEAALDLRAGRIDAVVMDKYVAINISENQDGIIASELLYENGEIAAEEYGIIVRKGDNTELLDTINSVIARLKAENKINDWVVRFANAE